MITLETACRNWHKNNRSYWKPNTARYIMTSFETYLFPYIGKMDLNKIRSKHIVSVIARAEKSAPTVARSLIGRLIIIFDIAIVREHCEHNVARPVYVVLKKRKAGGHAVLPAAELSPFYRKMDEDTVSATMTVAAFWAIQYSACRRSEVVFAKWEDIDFDAKLWAVPASNMKMGNQHLVPITHQLEKLLKRCKQGRKSPWVFPSPRKNGQPISVWSPWGLIRRSNYKNRMTIHGARKAFSTAAHESGFWSIDAIELTLAHKVPGMRGIYNKALMLDERRKLCQWYADKLDKMRGL